MSSENGHPYISDFVKTLMPDASPQEHLQAQLHLDEFLDVIDRMYEQKQFARHESSEDDSFSENGSVNVPL